MKKMKRVLLLVLAVTMILSMTTGVFAKSKKKKLTIIQPKVVDMMYSRDDGDNYKSSDIHGYIEVENKNKFHLKDVVFEISIYDEDGKRVGLEKVTMNFIEKGKNGVLAFQIDAKSVEKPELKVKVKKVSKKNVNKDKRPSYILPSDFEMKKVEDVPGGAIFSFKNKTKYDGLEPMYVMMFKNEEGDVFFGRKDYLYREVDSGETAEVEISKPQEDLEMIIKLIPRVNNF